MKSIKLQENNSIIVGAKLEYMIQQLTWQGCASPKWRWPEYRTRKPRFASSYWYGSSDSRKDRKWGHTSPWHTYEMQTPQQNCSSMTPHISTNQGSLIHRMCQPSNSKYWSNPLFQNPVRMRNIINKISLRKQLYLVISPPSTFFLRKYYNNPTY